MPNTTTLKDAVKKPKAKRMLKGIHFDFDGAELTYTNMEDGGACSLENDMVLAKAYESSGKKKKKNKGNKLTETQDEILAQIGESFTPLDKNLDEDVSPNEDEQTTKEGTDSMSEEILKEMKELKRENAVVKAARKLSEFEFDEDFEDALANSIADIDAEDSRKIVFKALKELSDRKDVAVEEAVEKALKDKPTGDTKLQKMLDEDAGEGGEPEKDVKKTLVEQIQEYQKAAEGEV